MAADSVAWLFALEQFGIKLGLDSISALLDALGHPERHFRSIHVAGTNGKGSVTAMVESCLRAAGFRTGRYTSPHLVDLRERFAVDGAMVSEDTLLSVLHDVRTVVHTLVDRGRLPVTPTFFEVTTAIAFEIFRRAGVRVAVCEVGLGGRLDATNVLQPDVTAITSIGLDHEQHLGGTLAGIAREKAGILKRGTPVVIGALPEEARDVVLEIARSVGAPVVDAIAEVTIQTAAGTRRGGASLPGVRLRSVHHDYGELRIGLEGDHQRLNASVAVRALELFGGAKGAVPPDAIVQGLAAVKWPARLETRTLPDGRQVLLDAAHNPDGARALAAYLETLGTSPRPLVFGAMRDKNIHGMLRELLPRSSVLVVTRASSPRSEDPEVIAALARALSPDIEVTVELTPEAALARAWRLSPSIVVAGSIFLLGDILISLEAS